MKVALSARAEADLRSIARWIASDNAEAAREFAHALRGKCASLAHAPKRFPVARRVDGRDLRKRTHGRYLILYIISDEGVEVIRIVHASRDWAALIDQGSCEE